MPYVQSSAFEQVSYDERAHTLCATFRESHRKFLYEDVPQEVYDGLIFSDSLGRYFNAHIRGHFPYREIREN
ncbi:MAG TPA: KTSC domain-containing protein [Rhizomicrobium sp.]|nr:KTSC domain-containing protein [Rhizomicrobium sp.]